MILHNIQIFISNFFPLNVAEALLIYLLWVLLFVPDFWVRQEVA